MHLIGAYVRLSPTNEDRVCGESGSIVSHPKRLTEYVERRNQESQGWGRIYDFYVDKDLSGKDTNRPELQRLLSDIVAGRVNVVLVTELSRLSRNTFDFLKIWQIFQIHQVQFISLREQFDTTSAAGRMMLLNMVNFAQFEREQTIERIRANNRSRAKQGLASPSQKHVLGYDHDPSNPGGLLPNPKEAAEVKAIFQTFLEQGSIKAATDAIFSRGLRTKEFVSRSGQKRGGKPFTANSLTKIVTNRAYLGEREINKRNCFKDQESLPPHDRYEVVKSIWPSIISQELFDEVQRRLAENYQYLKHSLGDPDVHPYLLTGRVVCAACGENLAGRSAKGRHGHYYHYYSHRPRRRDEQKPGCEVKRVRVEKLEQAVIGRLAALSKDASLLEALVNQAAERATEAGSGNEALLAAARVDHDAVSKKTEALVDRLAELPKGHAADVIYGKLEELGSRKKQLEESVFELERKSARRAPAPDQSAVARMLAKVASQFHRLPAHDQQVLVRDIIAKIEVRRSELTLFYYGQPAALSRGGDNSGAGNNKPRRRTLAVRGLSVHSFSGVGGSSDKTSHLLDTIEFQALAVPEPEAIADLYIARNLSTRQVAAVLSCGKGTVQRALVATGVAPRTRRKHAVDNDSGTYHVGQVPFGAKAAGADIVHHIGERRVIVTMRKLRAEGASFDAIVERLNSAGVRAKNGRRWHQATVGRILGR